MGKQLISDKKAVPRHRKEEELFPLYCDFSCRYAGFAPQDSTGACRREQAVYCTLVKKLTLKNGECLKQESPV